MYDITTSLYAALNRAQREVIDAIAKDGVLALKSVLNASDFGKSEYLKSYEIYAHVTDEVITFEILIDLEAFTEESKDKILKIQDEDESLEKGRTRTFGITPSGKTGRLYGFPDTKIDARNRSHDTKIDARKSTSQARDARVGSVSRSVGRTIRAHAPRSAKVDRAGKLSVRMTSTIQSRKEDLGVTFPSKKYEGIINDFYVKLKAIIYDKFAPYLIEIISRSIS